MSTAAVNARFTFALDQCTFRIISNQPNCKREDVSKKRKDDFSPQVIKTLERRVNGHCSKPDCRISTAGPSVDVARSTNIGVAAHIAAASPGGPRYDATMTSEARKSIENAIWLCSNCSTLIDRDPARYSVSLFLQWKKQAEKKALQEYAKPPVSQSEYDTLHGLIFGKHRRNLMSTAVADVCRMQAKIFEELDPRFSVDVSYSAGSTSYIFSAKEKVDISWAVNNGFELEFDKKFKDLIWHGKTLEITSQALRFEGSPVFADAIREGEGTLIFESRAQRPAIAKLGLNDVSENFRFDDILGQIVSGTKSMTFEGSALGNIYSLCVSCDFSVNGRSRSSGKINFECWEGKSVHHLPYFEKMYALFSAFFKEKEFQLCIEIEGSPVLSSNSVKLIGADQSAEVYRLLRYLRNVRHIARLLRIDVIFSIENEVTSDELKAVEELYLYLTTYQGLRGCEIDTCDMNLVLRKDATDDLVKQLNEGTHGVVRLEREYIPLNLCGVQVSNIVLNFTYTNAILQKKNASQRLIPGASVAVKVVPIDDCQIIADISNDGALKTFE